MGCLQGDEFLDRMLIWVHQKRGKFLIEDLTLPYTPNLNCSARNHKYYSSENATNITWLSSGILRKYLWEIHSVTSLEWHLLLSVSLDTSARQCWCSLYLRYSTLFCLFRSCSTLYHVPGIVCQGSTFFRYEQSSCYLYILIRRKTPSQSNLLNRQNGRKVRLTTEI